jgi:hypothetical protein
MENREGVEQISDKRATAAAGYLWIFFGMLISVVVPSVLMGTNPLPLPMVPLIIFYVARIVGLCAIGAGTGLYAKSKGYSIWWGLTGLVCVGILIVLALPDKNPEPDPLPDQNSPSA